MKLQDDLILSRGEQIEAVQTTVKSEIRSFSDVVKLGCEEKLTSTKLKAAVKSAVERDDRKKSVMVFGLEESENGDLRGRVSDLLGSFCDMRSSLVSDCFRGHSPQNWSFSSGEGNFSQQ